MVRLCNKDEYNIERVQHGIYIYREEQDAKVEQPAPEPEPEPIDATQEPKVVVEEQQTQPTPPQVQDEPEPVVDVEFTLDVVVSNGTVHVAKGSDGHLYRVEYARL